MTERRAEEAEVKSKVKRKKHIRRQPSLPPKAEELPTGKQPYRVLIALLTFTIAFIALDVASYARKSATWDEPVHVTAGYAALARHDYRVDPEHPPFLRIWAALPFSYSTGSSSTRRSLTIPAQPGGP